MGMSKYEAAQLFPPCRCLSLSSWILGFFLHFKVQKLKKRLYLSVGCSASYFPGMKCNLSISKFIYFFISGIFSCIILMNIPSFISELLYFRDVNYPYIGSSLSVLHLYSLLFNCLHL